MKYLLNPHVKTPLAKMQAAVSRSPQDINICVCSFRRRGIRYHNGELTGDRLGLLLDFQPGPESRYRKAGVVPRAVHL